MIQKIISNHWFKSAVRPLAPIGRKICSGPIILFFHGVTEQIIDRDVQSVHLEIKLFEETIHFLRKHYTIIGVNEYIEALKNSIEIPSNAMILQFDDGYANNLYTVHPLLHAYGIPFSVFLSTRHISEDIRFPTYLARVALKYTRKKDFNIHGVGIKIDGYSQKNWKKLYYGHIKEYLKAACLDDVHKMIADLQQLLEPNEWEEKNTIFSSDRPLSWDEAKKLSDLGVVIGAHCHDHCLLHERQPKLEVVKQISLSKSLIEEHLGKCNYFVYPNGSARDISGFAVQQLLDSGYDAAFSAIPGVCRPLMNRYILPRLCVTESVCNHIVTETSFMFLHNQNIQKWQKSFDSSSDF